MHLVMNMELWNSFPDDIKAIIEELNKEAEYKFLEEKMTFAEQRQKMEEVGWEVYELAPTEVERMNQAGVLGPPDVYFLEDVEAVSR